MRPVIYCPPFNVYKGLEARKLGLVLHSPFITTQNIHSFQFPFFKMVQLSQSLTFALSAVLCIQNAAAHPGHPIEAEIAERNAFYQHSKRDLTHCNDQLKKRGLEDKQRQRRANAIAKARAERGLPQSQ